MKRLIVALTLLVSSPAYAHIDLTFPPMRDGDQKTGPCEAMPRGNNPTVLEMGSTIMVTWSETVDHDGHYRIAFDMDGEDGFTDPVNIADTFNTPEVLVDGLPEDADFEYEAEITLPNETCDNCVLQLIQVMRTEDRLDGNGNNIGLLEQDFYYRCSDIMLVAPTPGDDMGTPDMGSDDMGNVVVTDPDTGNGNNGNNVNNTNDNNTQPPEDDAGGNSQTDDEEGTRINGTGGCATTQQSEPLFGFLLFAVVIAIRRKRT